MEKIDHLTKEQERKMAEFREEYRRIGLCTERADRQRAEKAITQMYERVGKKPPEFLWFEGQATALMYLSLNTANLGSDLWANLWTDLGTNLWTDLRTNLWTDPRTNLWANLWTDLGTNLWTDLRTNLWANLRANLISNLGSDLWANLGSDLWTDLGAKLWTNLGANLGTKLRANTTRCFWGQMETYWIAYYLFPHLYIRKMHTPQQMELLNLWDEIARSCCCWWPFEDACICSERPLEIYMRNDRLHCDGGPAFVSRDGWKMWYLNGIEVSQHIAESSPEELDPKLALSGNVEVRREVLRKIGTERAISVLNPKVLDEKTMIDEEGRLYGYRLLEIVLDGTPCPYLEMRNPSIEDVIHVEGVHERCETVEQALAWRTYELDFDGPDDVDTHRLNFTMPVWVK